MEMNRRFVGHPNLIVDTLKELTAELGWKFKSDPKVLWGKNEWDDIYCQVAAKKFEASFAVQQMPGCCAVLILHHVAVRPNTQEVFDALLQEIEKATYAAGFGSIQMAQVVNHGLRELERESWHLCLKRDWLMGEPFVNAKSGNPVVYLTKNMHQPGKRAGLEIG